MKSAFSISRFLPVLTVLAFAMAHAEENKPIRPLGGPPWEMELIFADEFAGDALDGKVWRSEEYGEKGIKHDTLRGPGNLEVRNGELLLHVRKEERFYKDKKTQWTAGFVYIREPVENNVYIEGRFRPGTASGVNNAFWLACMTEPGDTTRNKYELDIVETRKDLLAGKNTGRAHLAWHDWKTFKYGRTATGKQDHIAQGVHVEHTFDDYHTWGLWYGEDETIFYLDGREMWRGKTHPLYKDQWWTGTGKLAQWFPDEEKRTYGRHGQEDWSYNGGYAGDRMNIIFSNIPWGDDWSPLSDAADGTTMAVDYVRIFKPSRLKAASPEQTVDLGANGKALVLGSGEKKKILVDPPVVPDGVWPHYFSLVVKKNAKAGLLLRFEDATGEELLRVGVDETNELLAGFHATASSASAYPAKDLPRPLFSDGEDYLLVVRVTPGRPGTKDAVSLSAFKLPMGETREPYFYSNIDSKGNTGLNNGWQINQKGNLGGAIGALVIENSGGGDISAGPFRSGANFASVLPAQ